MPDTAAGKDKRNSLTKSWQKLRRSARIFHYMEPRWGRFFLGFVFLVLSTVTNMAFPALMGELVDASGNGEGSGPDWMSGMGIDGIALVLLALFGGQALFSFFRIYLFADVTHKMLALLRQRTYEHLIRLPMEFFSRERVGALNSRVSADISLLQETFTTTIAEFIRQVLMIGIGVVFLTYYSYQLTLLMLATLPVMALLAVFFGRYIKRLSKKTQDEVANSNVIVEETLSGIANVKAFANELLEVGRYRSRTEEVRRIAMRGAVWRGAFTSFIIFSLFGAIVLVIWYGAHLREAGEMTIGELITFILYSVFIGASVGGVADQFAKIQKAVGATEDLLDLYEESPEPIDLERSLPESGEIEGRVTFEEVSFAYPNDPDVVVLRNISFEAASGERVAIVGPSGAGKSTLISLILRFYDPQKGAIYVDGKPLSAYPVQGIRNKMAMVPQEVILFGGTIEENIRYGKPDASKEAIKEAARKANAEEFILETTNGYETVVGERGIKLSGGQRQRIAIARAILKDPAILILDEATSSLDSESENLVQAALDELMKGRTTFVIAHRLATVRNADKIMVLDQGELVEVGDHHSLMAKTDGFYRRMSGLQLVAE